MPIEAPQLPELPEFDTSAVVVPGNSIFEESRAAWSAFSSNAMRACAQAAVEAERARWQADAQRLRVAVLAGCEALTRYDCGGSDYSAPAIAALEVMRAALPERSR